MSQNIQITKYDGIIEVKLNKPKVNAITNDVNPRVTPKICGIVFLIPKLKPEYDATTLFGPGV